MEKVLIERWDDCANYLGRVRAESGRWEVLIDKENVPHLYVETHIEPDEEDGEVIKGMFCIEDMLPDDWTIKGIMLSQFGGSLPEEDEALAVTEWAEKKAEKSKRPPGYPDDEHARYPVAVMVKWNRATIRETYAAEGLPPTDDVDEMRVALAKLHKAVAAA
jgi:hypothetical protein